MRRIHTITPRQVTDSSRLNGYPTQRPMASACTMIWMERERKFRRAWWRARPAWSADRATMCTTERACRTLTSSPVSLLAMVGARLPWIATTTSARNATPSKFLRRQQHQGGRRAPFSLLQNASRPYGGDPATSATTERPSMKFSLFLVLTFAVGSVCAADAPVLDESMCLQGTVLETIDVDAYTYLRLRTAGGE